MEAVCSSCSMLRANNVESRSPDEWDIASRLLVLRLNATLARRAGQ